MPTMRFDLRTAEGRAHLRECLTTGDGAVALAPNMLELLAVIDEREPAQYDRTAPALGEVAQPCTPEAQPCTAYAVPCTADPSYTWQEGT